MSVTQYKGLRYVPKFADPEEWDSSYAYERMTIVLHEGNSYTSKQSVPKGVDINNENYWAETGNYNAQVEQYRKEALEVRGIAEAANETAEAASAKNNLLGLKKFSKCITFGDSWERGMYPDGGSELEHVGKGWLTRCAEILGVSSDNIINYASSGSGFALGNYNILNNLSFVSDDDARDCDLILIGGGLNDTDLTAARNNAVLTVKYLIENILPKASPNCEVHYFVGNAPVQNNTVESVQIWNGIIEGLNIALGWYTTNIGYRICVHSYVSDVSPTFGTASDARHLTEDGYWRAGGWCATRILSGGDHEYRSTTGALISNLWDTTLCNVVTRQGSLVVANIQVSNSTQLPAGTAIFQVPDGYRTTMNIDTPDYSYNTSDFQFRLKQASTSACVNVVFNCEV